LTLSAGDKVSLMASGSINATTAPSAVQVAIFIDGVQIIPSTQYVDLSDTGSYGIPFSIVWQATGLSAAAHTFDVRAQSLAGIAAVNDGGGLLALRTAV
jgi:hypothetical protein